MMEYSLTTAADALDNAQRNWKAWTIYGANFSDDSEAAADSREWKLIAGVVDDNVLRSANSTKFNFTLDTPADSYEYYKIVVTASSNGEELRMAEFEMKAVAPGTKLTNANDRFEFTMPDYSVIVSAEFVPESFTINWYDFYNNLIETDENVSAGEYPIFNGSLPATIEINGNQLYFFGWESEEGGWRDGELPSVSKNVDYRPVYLEFPRVNTAESENGTVSPDTDAALPGSTVTVTAAPEPGYHLGDLNVKTVRKEFTDLTALSGSGSSYENLVDGSMDDPSYEGKRGMQWQTDFTGSCYVILKATCKVAMSNYYLFAGDYNYTGDDRNWKDWTVYGANFENDSQAVRDSSKWQTVHEVTDDTRMARKNYYYSSNYNLNSTAEPYQYYKIEITASKGADIIQMSEFAMRGVFYVNTVYVGSTTRTFTMPEQNVEMQADIELQAAFEPHTLQGEPVWTWANDYSTASAAFTCSECGETQTFDAAVTSEASGKKTVYTAAVTVNGVEYTDSKTVFHNDFGEDLAGCTLSLGDDIGVNFFMELSEEVVESPNAKMVFTVENGEGKAP